MVNGQRHRAMDNFGGFILGRNMFGPVRGAWPDKSWKGWWGDNPVTSKNSCGALVELQQSA